MLMKSLSDKVEDRAAAIVFATKADEPDEGQYEYLPDLDGVFSTEPNAVVVGFKCGKDPSYGYTTLNRKQCMELALFLAECARHLEDE